MEEQMNTKYYHKYRNEPFFKQLKSKFNYQSGDDKHLIIAYHQDNVDGYLEFNNDDPCLVKQIVVKKVEVLELLIKKLLIITRFSQPYIYIDKDLYQTYPDEFRKLGFLYHKNQYALKNEALNYKRYIKIGDFPTGDNNNICDVNGVLVGHSSLNYGDIHTGVTAILPHAGNIFKDKVLGSLYVFNGFGKSMGLVQIEELGTIETPIILTNTLNIGKVSDGLISYCLNQNDDIGITTGTVNPVVLECNDGTLNDIRARVLDEKNVFEAINNAESIFKQGSTGAGSGMRCHGCKGGIGTSSRVVNIDNHDYTIGILVNSNFSTASIKDLIIKNRNISEQMENGFQDAGSIIVVIATDLPLESRQLKRICKRASFGIGKTGGYAGNGSGEVFVSFTTANIIKHYPTTAINNIKSLNDDYLDIAFKATVEATEEAILNSLLFSPRVIGVRGNVAESINEFVEEYDDLLI
jgi:D-aminopeptidase